MSRKKKSNDVLTPRAGAKVGERLRRNTELVALVKQGDKMDTLSVPEFAEALYGPGTQCIVIPPVHYRNKYTSTPLNTVAVNGSW